MALFTSNCVPLNEGRKSCTSTQEDTLPDAGRRFRANAGRDLCEVSPHAMCSLQVSTYGKMIVWLLSHDI